MGARINPSILSADFVNLESEFETISTADAIHVDVMDGHFVPNLTFGLPVVRRMIEIAKLPIDIHLMIENVDELAVHYADAGAQSVTFHQEASINPIDLARSIRSSGSKASIAVRPATSIEYVLDNLNEFDMVLIMTVEPGFGGQKFLDEMMPKVAQARAEIERLKLDIRIQVDGGIDESTIVAAARAGADTFVAGKSVFSKSDRSDQIQLLRQVANQHMRVL
jgi:ribulose-phosphate 3-epimerase